MDNIAGFIVHRSKQVLAVTALITIVAAFMLTRVQFNADVSSFISEGNPTGEQFIALQEKYNAPDPVNVLVSLPEGDSFHEPEQLVRLIEVRDLVAAVEGVDQIASIVPDVNPLTGAPLDGAAIAALPAPAIEAFLSQSPVAPLILSEDGRHTLLLVTPSGDGIAAARRIVDVDPPTGVELNFSGNPVVFASVLDKLSLVLLLIPPAVIVLLVIVFYATIGDRRLSLLAIFPAAIGSLWTFGLIFGLGREIDIVTVIVPIFVVVMGSADGLHFVTHFQAESERTADPVARVSSALSHVGVPMVLTTISTAVGFLSLLATEVQPIRQLGLFTAIGIAFAGIISFFSLPALISHLDIKPRHHTALIGPKISAGLQRLVRTRVPAGALAVGVLAFAAVSIPQLEVNPDQLFFFKDTDPVRVAFDRTEELFGGATPLAGEFAFDGSTENLMSIAEVSAQMEALPGVRAVFSAADLVGTLPEAQVAAILSGEITLPTGDMVSDDGLRFVLFPGSFDTTDLAGWLEFAESNDEVMVLTGMPVIWDEISRLVVQAQVVSLAVAFVLVALLLAAAYRRLRETLAALVPILLTVSTLLGFIAISGIQLNLLTAVVSSIVIGVGIDYAIHFVAAIDYARAEGDGYVLRALDRAGRPIVANALGIAIALSALWLSPLRTHGQISMIMWVAMTTAALSALLFIPALLPRSGVSVGVEQGD